MPAPEALNKLCSCAVLHTKSIASAVVSVMQTCLSMKSLQLSESLSFMSGPMMNTARMVKGRSSLSLFVGSSIPSASGSLQIVDAHTVNNMAKGNVQNRLHMKPRKQKRQCKFTMPCLSLLFLEIFALTVWLGGRSMKMVNCTGWQRRGTYT